MIQAGVEVLVATFGFFAALLLSLAVSSDNIAARLWVLVWLLPMLLLSVHDARAASVELRSGPGFRRRLPKRSASDAGSTTRRSPGRRVLVGRRGCSG